MTESPIFIGGLSYSGKTQLRQMLEAHPDVGFSRRTRLWRHHGEFGDLSQEQNRAEARSVLASKQSTGSLQPDWDKVFEEFETGAFTYARLFGIAQRQHAEAAGFPRWGEQYGGIVLFAEDIFSSFPEAKMIHMIREPATRLSRMAGTGRRPGWVGREAAACITSVRTARGRAARYPHGYQILSYEDLSRDPIAMVKALCEFIGIQADPIVRSGVVEEVRFDDSRALLSDVPPVISEFSRVVEGYLGSAGSNGSPKLGISTLVRFPVDSLAMLYGMYAPKWGRRG